ncbi:type IV pilin protein [Methylicorpusculum oleiharenae]|uniref:type IV pilin protein n=1 Tax=Methylicorpusculum oleiharenae TaxID=1338687 RepID=UPI0013572C24|nr:type IV pilin protein [Methylicorpusculum oleiharenae]MCD2449276.1 type IV pilin protein [Methylicorpusculum oleiharenae]
MKQTQLGFTLIELMITVAIVGILAGIAIPSYQDSVNKSRRADAKASLLGLANAMERHFTETNSYEGAAGTKASPSDTGNPHIYSATSPVDGEVVFYNLTINAATATTYMLYAAPTNAQANDKCGTLTLTQTGNKEITGAESGVVKADCW